MSLKLSSNLESTSSGEEIFTSFCWNSNLNFYLLLSKSAQLIKNAHASTSQFPLTGGIRSCWAMHIRIVEWNLEESGLMLLPPFASQRTTENKLSRQSWVKRLTKRY